MQGSKLQAKLITEAIKIEKLQIKIFKNETDIIQTCPTFDIRTFSNNISVLW